MFGICFAVFLIAFATVPAHAQQTTFNLNTPELVKGSTVYATVEKAISVENIPRIY